MPSSACHGAGSPGEREARVDPWMPSCSSEGRARGCGRSRSSGRSRCSRCSAARCSNTCSSGSRAAGVTRVIFGCGYLPDPIQACFGERALGLALEYVVEPRPMGTAGGIRHAARGRVSDTFLALNGDVLADAPLAELVAMHRDARRSGHDRAHAGRRPQPLRPRAHRRRRPRARLPREAGARGDRHRPDQRRRLRARAVRARPDRGRPRGLDRARDLPGPDRRGPVRASRRPATGRTSARRRATSPRITTCSRGACARSCRG